MDRLLEFIWIKKALDSVNHNILLYRIHNIIMVCVELCQLFSRQTACSLPRLIAGVRSAHARVTCGVTHCSVLGPLLFTALGSEERHNVIFRVCVCVSYSEPQYS